MNAYTLAKERYAALGVDTESVLNTLKDVTVSVHCWQGDDVVGFDAKEALSGGIQTTGNYPGKATTPEQLMADFDEVLRLTPGRKKLNLHASYAIFEDGEFADRDAIQPKHFSHWVAYAKERALGIDFNPTFFSHPMVKNGLPKAGWYVPVLNTDEARFGGYGFMARPQKAEKEPYQKLPYSAEFYLPPMSVTYYRFQRAKPEAVE